MAKDFKLVVSTDCTGLLGTPADWNDLWGFVKKHKKFAGFEMIAWGGMNRFWPERMLKQAKDLACPVEGIHGRTGKIWSKVEGHSRLKVLYGNIVYNETIVSTEYLFKNLASKVNYVLLHNTELRSKRVRDIILKNKENIKLLFIENGLQSGDATEVLEVAGEMQGRGIKIGVTFDLFHYYFTLDPAILVLDRWQNVLTRLDEFLTAAEKSKFIREIHVPLGERLTDSLPGEIGVGQLKELAKVIQGRIDYLGMEQQPWTLDFLFPTRDSKNRLMERNKRNINRLEEAGIL